jgi:hypothetical protein
MVRIPPKAAPDTAVQLGNRFGASAINRVKSAPPAAGGARYLASNGFSVTVPVTPGSRFPKGSWKSQSAPLACVIVKAETGTDKTLRIVAAPAVAIDSFFRRTMEFTCFTKLNVDGEFT